MPMRIATPDSRKARRRHSMNGKSAFAKSRMDDVVVRSDADTLRRRTTAQVQHEEGPRHEDRGEQGGDNADRERNREALDRSRTEPEEDECRDERRDLTIHDGR